MDSHPRISRGDSTLRRLLVSLTPDLLRLAERSITRRQSSPALTPTVREAARIYRGGVQLSEVEYDMSLPFLRKVTVRKASAWATDLPFTAPLDNAAPPRGGKLRRAGMVSVGGAFVLAAVGLLANRVGNVAGLGSRRGF